NINHGSTRIDGNQTNRMCSYVKAGNMQSLSCSLRRSLAKIKCKFGSSAITRPVPLVRQPVFQPAQLMWPFDPESVTIPLWAREKYRLTQYCPARNDVDIGAGQRVGLLT
ncbi:hypothetical protein TELCIR_17064, partial [Teladorsagia circumcincta]